MSASAITADATLKAGQLDASASTAALQLRNIDKFVKADLVKASCTSKPGQAPTGTTKIVGVTSSPAGPSIPSSPPPNTKITVPGFATITLNEQVKSSNGGLTVTAVHVHFLPSISRVVGGDVLVSQAVCGKAKPVVSPSGTPTSTPSVPGPSGQPSAPGVAPGLTGDGGSSVGSIGIIGGLAGLTVLILGFGFSRRRTDGGHR